MMKDIDSARLARRLSARFALELESGVVEVSGGRFACVRPTQLPEPNGFSIALARTPRTAEATFQPDRFSRSLVSAMAEADTQARQDFVALAGSLAEEGIAVRITVDDQSLAAAQDILDARFERLDIECTTRMPRTKAVADPEDSVLAAATACLSLVLALMPVEEVAAEDASVVGLPEGARTMVVVNRYERSPANRAACLAHYGARCYVCRFDFEAFYGELGAGYCEVHHRVPVSQMGGTYRIHPVRDLVPVCSNCHSMIHRREPPIEPEALRQLVESRRSAADTSTRN